MSKRTRNRKLHSNSTAEKNHRREHHHRRLDPTMSVYQAFAATGKVTAKTKKRHKELSRLHGLV